MIIFISEGRLGNQVFQYSFLRTIAKPSESIIVFGFNEFKEVFEDRNIISFFLPKKTSFLIRKIFKLFVFTKVISSLQVEYDYSIADQRREKNQFSKKKGFFSNVQFVNQGYFQTEDFFSKRIIDELKIKNKYLNLADNNIKQIPDSFTKVFIHIRRGDYANYKVFGKSTLLPDIYFRHCIEWFFENVDNPFFIFLSDEPAYIKETFAFVENKAVPENNHYGTDLAIMTMCEYGVLSPSSFSWWGSYLMKHRSHVFAPKFWLGFNSNQEFPSIKNNAPQYSRLVNVTRLLKVNV